MFCGMFETRRRQDLRAVFTAVGSLQMRGCCGASHSVLQWFQRKVALFLQIIKHFLILQAKVPCLSLESPFVGIDGIIKH